MLRKRRQVSDFADISKTRLAAAGFAWLALIAQAHGAETYKAAIEGAPNGLKARLAQISDLMKGAREYPTAAALRRAARRDAQAFGEALRAAGYYAGAADFRLIPGDNGAKPEVIFSVDTGPAFRIIEYEVLYEDEVEGRPLTFADAGVETKGAADGASLRARQEEFQSALWRSGYPAAEIVARRAIANFETGEASAVFVFRSGPKAKFGAPRIEGAEKTDPVFLARMKTWEEGEEFDRSKLNSYSNALRKTGLFASIDVAPGAIDENGIAPVIVRLEERKQRTIGAGVSYSTAEGPGGRLFFEHRNLFGHGENSRLEIAGSEVEQSFTATIARPLPRLGARAFASGAFENETTDAFNARSLKLSGGLTRNWLNDNLETRGALALETSKIRDNGTEERTYFVSTPLSVIWNSENDLLNPTKGFRASWTVTPYTGSDSFTQTELAARGRVHFGGDERVTLAARAALGATFANTLENLPRNKRFYAGGGGSVRGFSFQEAGPLDADNDPIGGLSRIDGALEARFKTIKNLQFAAFVDAGSVSSDNLPDFNDAFFIGYGGGVRYFTPIGPLRVDVAFPLDKRETDSDFQLYIALGQPF